MREMGAAEFKTHCLKVMDKVRRTRSEVIVTKHGVPIVRIVAADAPGPFKLGTLAGSFETRGDIVSSPWSDERRATSDERWDAMRLQSDELRAAGVKPSSRHTPHEGRRLKPR